MLTGRRGSRFAININKLSIRINIERNKDRINNPVCRNIRQHISSNLRSVCGNLHRTCLDKFTGITILVADVDYVLAGSRGCLYAINIGRNNITTNSNRRTARSNSKAFRNIR